MNSFTGRAHQCLTHALFAAVWGWSLSLDRLARPRRPLRVAFGLLLGMLAHGLYNFLILL